MSGRPDWLDPLPAAPPAKRRGPRPAAPPAAAGRVFGYVRVSTDEQATNGQSLAVQEATLHGWAQMTGRTIDEVFIEGGVSGGKEFADRPEGGRLFGSLRKGDTVVVAKLDRFSRNLLDCLHVSQELQRRGVALFLLDVGANDPVTGNGQSKLFLAMLGAFSEFERSRISERIRATKRAQAARGEFLGGLPPFGYRREGQTGLVPDEAQQRVIRRIKALKAKGLSLRAISAKLKAEGIEMSFIRVRKIALAGGFHQHRAPRAAA